LSLSRAKPRYCKADLCSQSDYRLCWRGSGGSRCGVKSP